MCKTKIVATIGPVSENPRVLERLIRAGLDVARLNFSHGTHSEMRRIIRDVRNQADRVSRPIGVMQDLQGPRIRLGTLPTEGLALKRGDRITLVPEGTRTSLPEGDILVPTSVPLSPIVKVGDPVLIKDGLVRLKVTSNRAGLVRADVEQGDVLISHQGLNVPESKLPSQLLTAKDLRDLAFGLRQRVDWIALSFVRNAADLRAFRARLPKLGEYRPKVIAKIERREAVENFEEILAEADAVMIARGDLGIELPSAEVPLLQKEFCEQAMAAAKPVIVATQMLESMTQSAQPTRAEVSDVANAVLDGTDAVMLSEETAIGRYPVQAVETMAGIIRQTEAFGSSRRADQAAPSMLDSPALIARTIAELADSDDLAAVVVMSASGRSAELIAGRRPKLPIIALTQSRTAYRQLSLVWGVRPFRLRRYGTLDGMIVAAVRLISKAGAIKVGDRIIVACGHPTGPHGHLNLLKVHTVRS